MANPYERAGLVAPSRTLTAYAGVRKARDCSEILQTRVAVAAVEPTIRGTAKGPRTYTKNCSARHSRSNAAKSIASDISVRRLSCA